MIRAYTSILYTVSLYVDVVSIDRYALLEREDPSEVG